MSEYVIRELERVGTVLLDRHFVYKSGKHGPGYINMDPLLPNTQLVASFCYDLTRPFWPNYDTIAAPAVGGIVLSILTAQQSPRLGRQLPAAVWADKVGDGFAFERAGFVRHLTGKRVLVVEDLLTTGGLGSQGLSRS